MLVSVACLVASLLLLSAPVVARLPDGRLKANHPRLSHVPKIAANNVSAVTDVNGTEIPPYDTVYYFEQLVDHNDPSKGNFSVRYWTTWEFYVSGGPIIMMTPGETNAENFTGYLTNTTINGQIAQQEGGATIVVEHRFFGLSNPYNNLSVESLQVHSVDQAIEDFDYFAKNVELPFPGGDEVGPDNAPWIFIGGSYPGALASWLKVGKPDTIYAAYSSSGTIEAITDFWRCYEPILQYMPANCSADVQVVTAYIDEVFNGTDETAIDELKELFGLGELSHLDDAAGALRNDLWLWQDLQPYTGPNATFFQFCDALEVKDGVSAPASGWGLDHALPAWGNFFKTVSLPTVCGDVDVETCFGTYNPDDSQWTDIEIDNSRSWFWLLCRELGFYECEAPSGSPTLISRLIQPDYYERQRTLMFSEEFSEPPVPDTVRTNTVYHGWYVNETYLFFANGYQDPWREGTISAETQDFVGTSEQPIEISNGFHTSDMSNRSRIDPTVAAVQDEALASFKVWLAAWPEYKRERELKVDVDPLDRHQQIMKSPKRQ